MPTKKKRDAGSVPVNKPEDVTPSEKGEIDVKKKDIADFSMAIQQAIKKKLEDEAKKKEIAAQTAVAEGGDKIVFTGLDNSGKTSIILALQKKYAKIAVLQPTRQTERTMFTYLGKQITRWDLGGQQRYRIAYLQNPAKYFEKTSACIFILDIQDAERVNEALTWFKGVLDGFQQLNITPPIYVFLHKADPEWMQIVDDLQESYLSPIKRKFQELVGNKHKISFSTTSIFNPWTIMSAFSNILLELYPKGEVINRTIEEFASKSKVEGMVVLDHNALILGQYFQNEDEKANFEIITPNVIQLFDDFRKLFANNRKLVISVNDGEYLFRAISDPIQSEERYLFIKGSQKSLTGINDADIDEFGNVLLDLLGKK